MALLSFDQIAESEDVTEEDITIPEWGGEVRVRSLTRRQMKDITKAAQRRVGKRIDWQADVFEKGVFFYGLVHPQIDEEKYEVLLNKNQGPMQKIMDAILRISKMVDDEEEANEEATAEEAKFSERSGPVS